MPNSKWRSILVNQTSAESHGLNTMIRAYCPQVVVLGEASNVAETIALILESRANLVFCDVLLDDGDVFELLDQLNDFQGYFILLASDEGFALRAIRYNVFDYLLKPITVKLLLDLMARLETHALEHGYNNQSLDIPSQSQKFATIVLNTKGVQYVVQITKIIHLKGDGNYSTVHLATGEKYLVSKPLKHFEEVLPARTFYRVHQSHLVNLIHVKSMQNGGKLSLNLSNGDVVPLARRKKDIFRAWVARQ